MKKTVLALLVVVALGMNSYASNKTSELTSVQESKPKLSTICTLVQKGDLAGVKNLIATGTDINRKSYGMTPLMFAARQNKIEIVKLLLLHDAKLKSRSDKGMTALDYAKNSKAAESQKLIEDAMQA